MEQVIPGYLPKQFRTYFRVSKETFKCILLHLSKFPTLQRRWMEDGRLQTTLEKYLMMLLWYLGTQETVRLNSDRFDVPKSTFLLHKRRLIDCIRNL